MRLARGILHYGYPVFLKAYQQVPFTFATAYAFSKLFDKMLSSMRAIQKVVEANNGDQEAIQAFLDEEEDFPFEGIQLIAEDLKKLESTSLTAGEVSILMSVFKMPEEKAPE